MTAGMESAVNVTYVVVSNRTPTTVEMSYSAGSEPDDPYILRTAPDGRVLWQTHDPLTDSAYVALKAAVTQFSPPPAKS
jgi:hypothetical protein